MRRDCMAQRLEARPRSPSLVDKNHTLRSRAGGRRPKPFTKAVVRGRQNSRYLKHDFRPERQAVLRETPLPLPSRARFDGTELMGLGTSGETRQLVTAALGSNREGFYDHVRGV
jgi:hypothetical protein